MFITGHLWFNLTKGFEKLNLKPGDKIQFEARVKSYRKGYQGRYKELLDPNKGIERTDYKLSYPTGIIKLE